MPSVFAGSAAALALGAAAEAAPASAVAACAFWKRARALWTLLASAGRRSSSARAFSVGLLFAERARAVACLDLG